jgi:hypothetical protein
MGLDARAPVWCVVRQEKSKKKKISLALRARGKRHAGLALRARSLPAEPRASRSGLA